MLDWTGVKGMCVCVWRWGEVQEEGSDGRIECVCARTHMCAVCVCVGWGRVWKEGGDTGESKGLCAGLDLGPGGCVCVCVGGGWGGMQQEGGDMDVSRLSGKNNKVDNGAIY